MATNQEIKKVLTILGTAYPSFQLLTETGRLYVNMLVDVPAGDLLAAAEAHIQRSQFFPKVAELRGGYVELVKSKPNIYLDCEESVGDCEKQHGPHRDAELKTGGHTRYCKHSCGYYVTKKE